MVLTPLQALLDDLAAQDVVDAVALRAVRDLPLSASGAVFGTPGGLTRFACVEVYGWLPDPLDVLGTLDAYSVGVGGVLLLATSETEPGADGTSIGAVTAADAARADTTATQALARAVALGWEQDGPATVVTGAVWGGVACTITRIPLRASVSVSLTS